MCPKRGIVGAFQNLRAHCRVVSYSFAQSFNYLKPHVCNWIGGGERNEIGEIIQDQWFLHKYKGIMDDTLLMLNTCLSVYCKAY